MRLLTNSRHGLESNIPNHWGKRAVAFVCYPWHPVGALGWLVLGWSVELLVEPVSNDIFRILQFYLHVCCYSDINIIKYGESVETATVWGLLLP